MRHTYSLCPICFKKISAIQIKRGNDFYLEKECPNHGKFSTIVWRGEPNLENWRGDYPPLEKMPPCPQACGLCAEHQQQTCCVIIEITNHCNLDCNICYNGGNKNDINPDTETVKNWISELAAKGKSFLQISGGEPTTRDDIPEIIAHAKECGFEYIQLNSNGLRIAYEDGYAKNLADAGLSFVFLQFDGTNDDIYRKLRNRELLKEKLEVIRICGELNIGVALVATLVPGINIDDIGNIIRLGASLSPAVRGVHFQPVGYMGKFNPTIPENDDRFTLPELIREITKQTELPIESILASRCDHAMCGFHGDFISENGKLRPLAVRKPTTCCCDVSAEANRNFIGRRWKRSESTDTEGGDSFEIFLENLRQHGFTITAMAFQDAYSIDFERICRCSLHVYKDKNLIPFCLKHILY